MHPHAPSAVAKTRSGCEKADLPESELQTDEGSRFVNTATIDRIDFDDLEPYRRELTGYCYRMLASPFDAEDAVQETFVRAWRGLSRFEDWAGLRPWLYRIATNVCLDMLKGRTRRSLPAEVSPAATGRLVMGAPRPETTWVQPISDELIASQDPDPGDVVVSRESIRLAFIAALQHLVARQRAVLILRDVLGWRASEVAEFLDTSEDAVNSTLRRARSAIAAADLAAPSVESSDGDRQLVSRYVDAFERYDVDALVSLLHNDVLIAMPPFELWIRGVADARAFLSSMKDEGGRDRVLEVAANGQPAVAVWRPGGASGTPQAYAIMVLEVGERRILSIHAFLDTAIFSSFGLPTTLE
jgi:RNA polymerase sigma-70 factor (ECF subfamily)